MTIGPKPEMRGAETLPAVRRPETLKRDALPRFAKVKAMVYGGYGAPQGKDPSSINLQTLLPAQKDQYFYQLQCQGWEQLGGPMEYQMPATLDQLRAWAREYAAQNSADLIIETEDPTFSQNPHNNMVFFIFRHAASAAAQNGAAGAADPYGYQQQQQQQQGGGLDPRAYTCTTCGRPFAAHPQYQPSYVNCPNCAGQVLISLDTGTPVQANGAAAAAAGNGAAPSCSERQTISSEKKLVLMSSYASNEQALDDCLEKLAMLLAKEDHTLNFADTGQFLHPSLTVAQQVYLHMGSRHMDLVLVHDGVHDYTLLGNEAHSAGGNISPMRDNLVTIKTLGATTYMPLPGLRELDPEQKDKVTRTLFQFLSQHVNVV